jgi:hypothetical protein
MRAVYGNVNGRRFSRAQLAARLCVAAAALLAVGAPRARAQLTPESPEVKRLVDSGLTYLESHPETRLGGQCLIGLAFIKAGRLDHPRVTEALNACAKQMKDNLPEAQLDEYNYSDCIATIFLCEASSKKYAREIEYFLSRVKKRQKPIGAWGYRSEMIGDTSQTQYGALTCWEANRRGFSIDGPGLDNLADWLIRTQSPDGCWGYKGQVSPTDSLIPQEETNCSMLAAGLGSLYICADLFGMQPKFATEAVAESTTEALPSALRRVDESGSADGPKRYQPQRTTAPKVLSTMNRAHQWMEKNYAIDIGPKCFYFLYGLERYKSFQEAFEHTNDKSPKWYNDGYKFLLEKQAPDGSWSGYCGPECDTAFSILFLLRSTQKSIHAKLGEGMLLAGRGLPTNLSRAKMRNGQLIVDQVHTKVDELLTMIDDGDEAVLDDLARDPSQLIVEQVDENSARRLQQLVRGGEPQVRLLAVRALGRSGNLDYVPSLLYALTDPDRRVVLEARDELRFISRDFSGGGPPENFTEQQRFDAIEAWKKWYLSIRPTAVLEK